MATASSQIERTLGLMLAGQLDLLQGCRTLVAHARELERIAPAEFLVIVAIESETDDIPLGEVRTQWNKEALKEVDRLKEAYLGRVEAQLRVACESMLTRLTKR
ncbi:hypothetical protein KRR26_31385 [Corallococcus sp. M34]|uniref:hypothetical protein n=1 Tax=Citreicoccus inhibens TaxID=2849499 RepID=UPI0011C4286D|nr:hypothetical protein [Citreicoccus inhibens]MBU8900118.1 hypothetical protein [Citreicoccus inhibens]